MRILAGRAGTESVTRVLVTSFADEHEWTTVGVHANVVEASWQALVDSLIFALGPVGNGPVSPAAATANPLSVDTH